MIFGKLLKRGTKDIADEQLQEIITLAGRRTEHFYAAHKLCCSEAVLLVVNEAFGGDLSPELCLRLGSGFCHGMGGAGCVCGALSGGQLVLSLFLSPHHSEGLSERKFRKLSKQLHDRFQGRFNTTCCRELIQPLQHDRKARKTNCQMLTGVGAELATELLLKAKPALLRQANLAFLGGQDEKLSSLVGKLRKG